MPSIARDLEAATRDLPLVGYLFSCDWSGVRVQRSALLAALAAAGLGQYAPPAVSHQVSLHRAIRAWIAERAAAGERAGLGNQGGLVAEDEPGSGAATRSLVRVARTSGSAWILFAVVAEAVDLAALGMDYATDLRVLVHKQTGQLIVTTEAAGVIDDQAQAPPAAQAIARQLRPHWEHFQGLHTAGELGDLTRAALRDLRALTVQPGSGWAFVPLAHAPALSHLRDLIDRLPTATAARPATLLLGQLDTAATRKQLAQAAYRDFMSQLDRRPPGPRRLHRPARRDGARGDRRRPAGRLQGAQGPRRVVRRAAGDAAGGGPARAGRADRPGPRHRHPRHRRR